MRHDRLLKLAKLFQKNAYQVPTGVATGGDTTLYLDYRDPTELTPEEIKALRTERTNTKSMRQFLKNLGTEEFESELAETPYGYFVILAIEKKRANDEGRIEGWGLISPATLPGTLSGDVAGDYKSLLREKIEQLVAQQAPGIELIMRDPRERVKQKEYLWHEDEPEYVKEDPYKRDWPGPFRQYEIEEEEDPKRKEDIYSLFEE